MQLWFREPQVTTPVLKLFTELVQNRSQRLLFDVSSPNGILLFREASKIICSYGMLCYLHLIYSLEVFSCFESISGTNMLLHFAGQNILNVEVSKEQMYPMKLKGISVCFSMLKAALCGSYVNFGVFRLYNDEALDDALKTFVKLLLSIPHTDLLVSSIVVLGYIPQRKIIIIFSLLVGLPQIVPDVLLALGLLSTRPHDLPSNLGASRVFVHYVIYL